MNNLELLDLLGDIRSLAERAELVTLELICDYGFAKSPDPLKAIAYSNGKGNTAENRQSFTWYAEYEHIFTFIEIANDYIQKIERLANTVS
ncbi:MAG: hypothetical protein K2H01_09190 [Ruminococcus sp.]|nr:hypothetical protein [Ruminococcus sp.]